MKLVRLKTNFFIYIRAEREISMDNQENLDYYILSLSRKKVSLFKLHETATEEIRDGIFPMSFSDDHEYGKANGSNHRLKNFEKDKAKVEKERFRQFLRSVNEELGRYLD